MPLFNFVCHALGKEKVLILGGSFKSEMKDGLAVRTRVPVLQILDLSAPLARTYAKHDLDPDVYLPSFLD
jgi:hypothetical protein